jgi:pimeloyl-ACP methyl ester carboxylesterase
MQSKLYLCAVALVAASGAGCSEDKPTQASDSAVEAADGSSDSPDAGQVHNGGTEPLAPLPEDVTLPIVFVHGGAGSAQQYASQAMRFAANGYPQERIVAYDHDGAGFEVEKFLPGLDAVIDEARERFDVEQVYLVGHSRGTLVSANYLMDPAQAAKVAKYISLDGGPCPADGAIPCISPNQGTLPGQRHVEVATSRESFVEQYKFLVGEEPQVIDVVKQAAPVEISGRAVNFPQNTGRDGTRLEFWVIDPETGERTEDSPVKTFDIGPDGAWGPLVVSPDEYYELVLYTPGTSRYQHFYPQRYLRSSHLERLLSGPPESDSRLHTNVGDGHAALTVLRMREWMPDDVLEIGTTSESGDQTAQNVITEDNVSKATMVSGRSVGEPIALYIHDDAATPGETTLEKLPWFPEQFFQTGIDVYMPAAEPPNGTISLTSVPRGYTDKPQTLNVPNWSSTDHTVMVIFSDYPQD